MGKYVLNINGEEVSSTNISYQDLVFLVNEFIKNNNYAPRDKDFKLTNNLPSSQTLYKILKENSISCFDFWSQFGTNTRRYISNLIPNVAEWMIQYIDGGYEVAKNILANDNHKIKFVCPLCGNKVYRSPNYVHKYGFNCPVCSDGISYPNKFAYELLNQLSNVYHFDSLEHEYCPTWAGRYRYDNYFEYNGSSYILEMDGGFHKNNIHTKSDYTLEDRKRIDKEKDLLAINHDIKIIRIDCDPSTFDTIKTNILKSDLNNIFDLNIVNFNKCNEFAMKNIIKEVCEYYNDNQTMNLLEISKHFNLHKVTIRKYLKNGAKLGWCKYNPYDSMRNYQSEKYGCHLSVENPNTKEKILFDSINQLASKSDDIFGIKMARTSIQNYIDTGKLYKGFIISSI